MLLKFYRTNQPLVLVLLPLIITVFWFPSFSGEQGVYIKNSTPLFRLIEPHNEWGNRLLGMFFVLLGGLILNRIINRNEFFTKNTFLPSFFYVVLLSVFVDANMFHPIVVSNFFLILALQRLVNIHSQVSCKSEMFDAGFYVVLASLFYLPSIVYFPMIWMVWFVFRPFNIKEFLMPLVAVLIILVYYFSSFLLFDSVEAYHLHHLFENSIYITVSDNHFSKLLLILMLVLSLLGFVEIGRQRQSNTMRFKKLTNSLLIFAVFSFLISVLLFIKTSASEVFLLMMPICSVALTYLFVYFKKEKLGTFLFYLLVLGILLNNYLG